MNLTSSLRNKKIPNHGKKIWCDRLKRRPAPTNALKTVREYIERKSAKLWKARYGYMSVKELGLPKTGLELEICFSPLEKPNDGECIVFSVGHEKEGIKFSDRGKKAIKDLYGTYDRSLFRRIGNSRCWKYGQTNLYAAVARNHKGATSRASRDLRMVQEAFRDTILERNTV